MERLRKLLEQQKDRRPIIVIDFDGTIIENKFPEIGAFKE